MGRLIVLFIAIIFVLSSCSSRDVATSKDTAPPSDGLKVTKNIESELKESGDLSGLKHDGKVYGKVKIIDSAGLPIENVGAIATLKPNAFDEPLAWGNLSGKDGISEIWVPKNLHLYIRAWDPKLKYFPNNFYEIPPTDSDSLQDMTITMLESTAIEMTLYDSDDNPIAKQNVGLMMIHSKYGPWWPCDGYTDENGNVTFALLPPGIYNLRVKTESGIVLEIKEVTLPPGSHTVLGKIKPR